MTVAANFPKERVPAKDEKPEDKAKLDQAFQDKQTKADDKLKQEKAFEGWTFLVPSWNVDQILKERKDLLAEKKDETKTAEKHRSNLARATRGIFFDPRISLLILRELFRSELLKVLNGHSG